jgi:glycosyltransferase involved in cell wall biosynthesis
VIRLPLSREKGGRLRYVFDYLSFFCATALALGVAELVHHYDAVQVATMPDFLAFATFAPRARGAKVVVFMQEPSPELVDLTIGSRTIRSLYERIEQAVLRFADLSFTVTEQLRSRYVARGADPSKIRVVLNGPDPAIFARAEHVSDSHFTLLSHGSIEDRYGHDDLLEAVRIARRSIPDLRLDITGTGSGADRLVRRIEELGLDQTVRYLGHVPLDELLTRISSADIGIVAMRDTAYANLVHTNKMFDFIIAAVPVIATRLDAVCAYFPEDAIALVEPGNPDAMAAAIVDLYRDPDRRRAMTQRASELYASYGWPAQKHIYVESFASVL